MTPKQLRDAWLRIRAEQTTEILAKLNDQNSAEILAERDALSELHRLFMGLLDGLPKE